MEGIVNLKETVACTLAILKDFKRSRLPPPVLDYLDFLSTPDSSSKFSARPAPAPLRHPRHESPRPCHVSQSPSPRHVSTPSPHFVFYGQARLTATPRNQATFTPYDQTTPTPRAQAQAMSTPTPLPGHIYASAAASRGTRILSPSSATAPGKTPGGAWIPSPPSATAPRGLLISCFMSCSSPLLFPSLPPLVGSSLCRDVGRHP